MRVVPISDPSVAEGPEALAGTLRRGRPALGASDRPCRAPPPPCDPTPPARERPGRAGPRAPPPWRLPRGRRCERPRRGPEGWYGKASRVADARRPPTPPSPRGSAPDSRGRARKGQERPGVDELSPLLVPELRPLQIQGGEVEPEV